MDEGKIQSCAKLFAFGNLCALMLTVGCAGVPNAAKQETPAAPESPTELWVQQQRDRAEYEAALARWRQGDDRGCREDLEKLLARNPRHVEARLLLADLLLTSNECQAAYEQAKAAVEEAPNDARVQFAMAVAYDALDKPTEALAYYERAAKMAPNQPAFAAAYESARKAARGEAAGSAVATRTFTPAAGRADSSGAADCDDSVDYAGIAASENPQVAVSAAAKAMRAGRPATAVKILLPASRRFPNSAAVHRALGAAHYLSGDYASSQVALQQALSLDKSSALSYLLMGHALAGLGQREAAESHFRQAAALDPRCATR